MYAEHTRISQELQLKHQALDAFTETVGVFDDQLRLHERFKQKAAPHDITKICENFELLKRRRQMIVRSREGLASDVKEQMAVNRAHVANMNSLKPEIKRLHKLRDTYKKWLLDRGESHQSLDNLIESSSGVGGTGDAVPAPHQDEKTWLIRCNRSEAERLLHGRSDGTFLIRPSSVAHSYALSIVANGAVVHCMIEKHDTGYGFAEPYFIHESLRDLVMYYRETTLVEHNEILDVTLRNPVLAAASSAMYGPSTPGHVADQPSLEVKGYFESF